MDFPFGDYDTPEDLAAHIDDEGGYEYFFCFYRRPEDFKGTSFYEAAVAFKEARERLDAALKDSGVVL